MNYRLIWEELFMKLSFPIQEYGTRIVLIMWFGASHSTSLYFSFPIYKVEILTVLISKNYYEDEMKISGYYLIFNMC